jgi:hypothetical protein
MTEEGTHRPDAFPGMFSDTSIPYCLGSVAETPTIRATPGVRSAIGEKMKLHQRAPMFMFHLAPYVPSTGRH